MKLSSGNNRAIALTELSVVPQDQASQKPHRTQEAPPFREVVSVRRPRLWWAVLHPEHKDRIDFNQGALKGGMKLEGENWEELEREWHVATVKTKTKHVCIHVFCIHV